METRALIYSTINNVIGAIGAIGKHGHNQKQGYAYRKASDVVAACQPLFAKFGLLMQTTVIDVQRTERATQSGGTMTCTVLKVGFEFFALDGSSVVVTTIGESNDSGDKGANKAMTAACKYALCQLFLIPEELLDTEEEPLAEIRNQKMPETKAPIPDPNEKEKLLNSMLVNAFKPMPIKGNEK